MRKVVNYKIKWVFIKGKAIKRTIPIYEDLGQGGGLEKTMNSLFTQLTNTDTGRKIA